MSQKRPVIAIDGPSGSGKSTVARRVAHKLGVLYIDTGAMFRALALEMSDNNLAFESGQKLDQFLSDLKLVYGQKEEIFIIVNDRDLTARIREHQVSKLASIVSQLPAVRRYLLQFQRDLAQEQVCVMEGRDIATVVFPDAFSKFFISASVEERARRRWDQLKELNADQVVPCFDQVLEDVRKRDESDMNRSEAPLKQAPDAHFLDTSEMGLERVLEAVIEQVHLDAQRFGIILP